MLVRIHGQAVAQLPGQAQAPLIIECPDQHDRAVAEIGERTRIAPADEDLLVAGLKRADNLGDGHGVGKGNSLR